MKKIPGILLILSATFISFLTIKSSEKTYIEELQLVTYEINPKNQKLQFFWKNKRDKNYKNFQNLKSELQNEGKRLVFAMNGGMYFKDLSPQGLYIESGIIKSDIDTVQNGYGNFYLQPNGVFYLTKNREPVICTTKSYRYNQKIEYATQSGPMLVIDGKIHPKFTIGSPNVHIRNGVGILPNGNLLFAMSKEKVNFYDFANYFKKKGCKKALYLDGFVSRTYLPSVNWKQLDGNFGVIIAEIK